jgi:uncharacterized protein YijF (DUF1287 family)
MWTEVISAEDWCISIASALQRRRVLTVDQFFTQHKSRDVNASNAAALEKGDLSLHASGRVDPGVVDENMELRESTSHLGGEHAHRSVERMSLGARTVRIAA